MELALDSKVKSLPNSDLVKDELVKHVRPEASTDDYVKQKIIDGLKACK